MAIEQARRLAVEELAKMPISAFRNAVAGALAVVDAQRRLRFEPTGDLVQDMLNAALDIVRAECGLHEAVAPDRTGTRQWSKKVELLAKALEWRRKAHLNDDPWHRAQEDLADLPEQMSQREALRRQLPAPTHVRALTSTGRAPSNQ